MKKLGLKLRAAFFIALVGTGFSFQAQALEVKFEEDRKGVPLVFLNLAISTGNVTDPAERLGLTNFLGEMLLRGTESRSKEQIDLTLDQIGARLTVETRAEALILRGAVIESELPAFLDLLKEVALRPSFPKREIRKLKSEIVSAILQQRADDRSLVSRHFQEFLFLGHPYGKPTVGKIKDVQGISADDLKRHYDRLFTKDLLLVVGTGPAKESRIKKWAEEIAEARPAGGEKFRSVPAPVPQKKKRLLIVDKPDRTQTQILAGQTGIRLTDDHFFPLYVANHVFGGGSFSARMMTEIRKERGWSYGAYSYFRHGTEPRSWQLHLFPASRYTPEALKYTLEMVENLKKKGITAAEFEFARNSLMNSAGFMYNTPEKRVENALLERTLNLPDGFFRTYAEKIEKVTHAEVNEAVRKYFEPGKLAIAVLGTASDIKKDVAAAAGIPEKDVVVIPYTQE